MPERAQNLGERISGLEATVSSMDNYSHERWHKLANDMMPLLQLPERLTRDVAKMDGKFEGRINSVVKDLERTITEAVEKAVEPIAERQADHERRIDTLEAASNKLTGAKLLLIFVVQTLIAALSAMAGAFEFTRHP